MEDFAFNEIFYNGGGPDTLHPAYWFRIQPDELKWQGTGFLRRTEWQDVDSVSLLPLDAFPADASTYYTGANVSIHPCYWFRMSARDLARFGWLFLNNGEWNGQQIIPGQWVQESTTTYSPAWFGSGYGYMWWVAVDGNMFPGVTLPEGSFAALGLGGHCVIVIPAFDTVIVHRMDTETDRQAWSISREQLGRFLKILLEANNKRLKS